jgi:hypothetical protein
MVIALEIIDDAVKVKEAYLMRIADLRYIVVHYNIVILELEDRRVIFCNAKTASSKRL